MCLKWRCWWRPVKLQPETMHFTYLFCNCTLSLAILAMVCDLHRTTCHCIAIGKTALDHFASQITLPIAHTIIPKSHSKRRANFLSVWHTLHMESQLCNSDLNYIIILFMRQFLQMPSFCPHSVYCICLHFVDSSKLIII